MYLVEVWRYYCNKNIHDYLKEWYLQQMFQFTYRTSKIQDLGLKIQSKSYGRKDGSTWDDGECSELS